MKREEMIGTVVLAVMLLSLAGTVYVGFGKNIVFPLVFSGAIAFSLFFFTDWFEGEE